MTVNVDLTRQEQFVIYEWALRAENATQHTKMRPSERAMTLSLYESIKLKMFYALDEGMEK